MERRFRIRLDELLGDAEVRASLLTGAMPRLETFLRPFVAALHSPEQAPPPRDGAAAAVHRHGAIDRAGFLIVAEVHGWLSPITRSACFPMGREKRVLGPSRSFA
jgi:hypothetical protein